MPDVKTYNVNRVSVIFGGIALDSGFGENDVFTFVPKGPAYGSKTGADGEVCRFATNERGFNLKVKLMQSSDKNGLLSTLFMTGLMANNGSDVAALLLKDNNGSTVIASAKAWLTQPPEIVIGKEVQEREWDIEGVWDAVIVGGN